MTSRFRQSSRSVFVFHHLCILRSAGLWLHFLLSISFSLYRFFFLFSCLSAKRIRNWQERIHFAPLFCIHVVVRDLSIWFTSNATRKTRQTGKASWNIQITSDQSVGSMVFYLVVVLLLLFFRRPCLITFALQWVCPTIRGTWSWSLYRILYFIVQSIHRQRATFANLWQNPIFPDDLHDWKYVTKLKLDRMAPMNRTWNKRERTRRVKQRDDVKTVCNFL